jgi:ElaB/YqjD/DUF883 family membrane-anchored ribosome-binding protein
MKNRIPVYLASSPPPHPAAQEECDWAQKQIADRIRQVEKVVHEHPGTALGAAFCIGIFLGWIIRRR